MSGADREFFMSLWKFSARSAVSKIAKGSGGAVSLPPPRGVQGRSLWKFLKFRRSKHLEIAFPWLWKDLCKIYKIRHLSSVFYIGEESNQKLPTSLPTIIHSSMDKIFGKRVKNEIIHILMKKWIARVLPSNLTKLNLFIEIVVFSFPIDTRKN